MPYFLRLFSKKAASVPIEDIRNAFDGKATFELLPDDSPEWRQLLMKTPNGNEVCLIEKGLCEADDVSERRNNCIELLAVMQVSQHCVSGSVQPFVQTFRVFLWI